MNVHDAFASARAADGWPAPDMSILDPERPSPPRFPDADVFGEGWARWIERAAISKGAPPDYVASALLVVASAMIGNARWTGVWPGWKEPCVLWAMNIGLPSSSKSPALDAVISPLQQLEKQIRDDAEAELREFAGNAEIAEIADLEWKKQAKEAVAEKREVPPRPEGPGPTPIVPDLIVQESTIEKLVLLMADNPKGFLNLRDELAGLLGNLTRYAGGGSDGPFWLEAYGGRPYSQHRVGRPPARADRLSISLLGGIQPDKLNSLLMKADDDGMCARFMPIWPEPVRPLRPSQGPDEAFLLTALQRLRGLKLVENEDGSFRPWIVPFTDGAQAAMLALKTDLQAEEASRSGLLLSFAGKVPGLTARIALVLAHLDWVESTLDDYPREVTTNHFGRAAHFTVEYLLPMAARAYADTSLPEAERAARVLAEIIVGERWQSFSARDVTARKRRGLRSTKDVEKAVAVLEDANWVERHREQTATKPRTSFIANPAVWGRT
ncbi:MAG: DUF3987 domain-containing protein [Pseudomonadota bacterium]